MSNKLDSSYKQPELIVDVTKPTSISRIVTAGSSTLEMADARDCYASWPQPTLIISDGAYGVDGFPGDPPTTDGFVEWYTPHVEAWTQYALPETTLWFWNTEIGWATVHPVLVKFEWEYRGLHIWDKSVAHIAGNVNSKTIRSFPVVTEVCARYVREVKLPAVDGQELAVQQ